MRHTRLILNQIISTITENMIGNKMVFCKDLPANVRTFVQHNFPNKSIAFAENNGVDYLVRLNDGTEISFSKEGVWKEVNGLLENDLFSPVPVTIIDNIKRLFDNANVVSVVKGTKGYEISFSSEVRWNNDRHSNIVA